MDSQPLSRKLLHTRHVTCTGYLRSDGLLDIEAELKDISPDGTDLIFKIVQPGEDIHHMRVVLTLDREMNVVDAAASFMAAPTQYCGEIAAAYRELIGMQIGAGFQRRVKETLAGVKGCTHMTELLGPLATTAMQSRFALARMTHDVRAELEGDDLLPRPVIVDTCHTYRLDGEAMKVRWPEGRRGGDKR
jgi:hypothetical protein